MRKLKIICCLLLIKKVAYSYWSVLEGVTLAFLL